MTMTITLSADPKKIVIKIEFQISNFKILIDPWESRMTDL